MGKRSYAVLLGAGASIDAGIPSSFAMTRRVYEELVEQRNNQQAALFGYVLTKLIGRRVLSGGSPFDPVNIEEAYDTVLRLVNRDQDVLSDFVQGWDPILSFMKPAFDERAFITGIVESIQDQRRGRIDQGIINVDQHRLQSSAHAISAALSGSDYSQNSANITAIYIDILVKILASPSSPSTYMDDLAAFCIQSDCITGTLNYDLLFEQSISRLQREVDYGLSEWNDRQIVRWNKGHIKLAKMHGSINWSGHADHFSVLPDVPTFERWQHSNALMIFGGQSSKLTPHGPFLQLRHLYESLLMKSDTLVVAGYSFGDAHINSMLKRWISTRKKAKMVVLDPSRVPFELDLFQSSYAINGTDKHLNVQLVHVQKTAALGMRDAISEARARIDTTYPEGKNGYLPRVLVKVIN